VRPGAPSSVERAVVVPRQGTRQVVMYFNTADEVLPPAETRASGAPPQTTAAGTQPMTRTQEQQQMPLPTQANDHSAVGNDNKK
jgi:hypothetical protein